jgi:hypothetical protein
MDRQSYGINRVAVVLNDGTEHRGVHVAWATEIVRVEGCERVPFEGPQVIDVRPDPAPEDDENDHLPF